MASDGAGAYLPQRLFCSIAMATDLPLVQTTIAGPAIGYVGVKKKFTFESWTAERADR
jgi:hypothetical protein